MTEYGVVLLCWWSRIHCDTPPPPLGFCHLNFRPVFSSVWGRAALCSLSLMTARSIGGCTQTPSKRMIISGPRFICFLIPLSYILFAVLTSPPHSLTHSLTHSLLPSCSRSPSPLPLLGSPPYRSCIRGHSGLCGRVRRDVQWLFLVSWLRGPCNVLMDSAAAAWPPGRACVVRAHSCDPPPPRLCMLLSRPNKCNLGWNLFIVEERAARPLLRSLELPRWGTCLCAVAVIGLDKRALWQKTVKYSYTIRGHMGLEYISVPQGGSRQDNTSGFGWKRSLL